MMAWRVHEFGPPHVMRFERVPRPNPGPGEVLVKVEAAGIGPWDAWIREGKSDLPQPLPLTPGSDLRNRETGQSRGFGFVEMANADQGRQACDALNEREFEGRRLTVNEARPQERKSGGYAGGGGQTR